MRPREIAEIALRKKYVTTQGSTLAQTFSSKLSTYVKKGGERIMKKGAKYSINHGTAKGNQLMLFSEDNQNFLEDRFCKFLRDYESAFGPMNLDYAVGPFCAKYLYYEDTFRQNLPPRIFYAD